ncbi:hypothetical protein JXL83_00855 [candidate division WOR-3 bacterium]|nr:hypothetical protein [candidate division WOR-3 bacterium]
MSALNCFALIFVSLSACSNLQKANLDSNYCQNKVDEFNQLIKPYFCYEETDPDKRFDVTNFLLVLDLLSMDSGYRLDFLYMPVAGGGQPVLVSIPVSQSIDEFADKFRDIFTEEEWQNNAAYDKFFEHIRTDGSPEAFFQLAILGIMGNHFCLFWHSLELDDVIICSQSGLDELINTLLSEGFQIPPDALKTARETDLTPSIIMTENSVEISVIAFTKYGGFEKHTLVFNSEFPHILLSRNIETVAWCFIGGIH